MMIEIPGDLFITLTQLFRYASRRPSLRTEKKWIRKKVEQLNNQSINQSINQSKYISLPNNKNTSIVITVFQWISIYTAAINCCINLKELLRTPPVTSWFIIDIIKINSFLDLVRNCSVIFFFQKQDLKLLGVCISLRGR